MRVVIIGNGGSGKTWLARHVLKSEARKARSIWDVSNPKKVYGN